MSHILNPNKESTALRDKTTALHVKFFTPLRFMVKRDGTTVNINIYLCYPSMIYRGLGKATKSIDITNGQTLTEFAS